MRTLPGPGLALLVLPLLAAPAPGQAPGQRPITFAVQVPAQARLWIDGEPTKSTGAARRFESPSFPVGKEYRYTLRAVYRGREVVREVKVAPGRHAVIDLRPDFETAGREGTVTLKPLPLWERLGGEARVRRVVGDWLAAVAEDRRVNFDRGGRHRLDAEAVADLKKHLLGFVSEVAGGPLKYTGRGMKEVHRGMAITGAEFDALLAALRRALEQNGIARADAEALLTLLGATRKAIVEPRSARKPSAARLPLPK